MTLVEGNVKDEGDRTGSVLVQERPWVPLLRTDSW